MSLDRRDFLAAAALAAAALAHAPAVSAADAPAQRSSPPPDPKRPAKIRVGCLSWCFHSFSPGADPTDAIETIGQLGFDGIELILLARDDIANFWTDAKIADLRKRLDKHKLAVSQFVIFQPVVEGLTSLRRDEREQNLDYFEAGCKIGKKFDAPMLNIVAPWARELGGHGYLPRYYELDQPQPGQKFHIDVAPDFDWDAVWNAYVETTKQCLARAKTHGLRLTIEHHTHCLVPDAVSFLRLYERVNDPALGYNLDTGWTLLQREYPPVAIHKVARQLANVHVRDIDGRMRQFVHFGEGVMDFAAVVEALRKIDYQGYVSIEQDKHPGDMLATCRRYLKTMRELIG